MTRILLKIFPLFTALFLLFHTTEIRADVRSHLVLLLPDTTEIAPFSPSDSLAFFEKDQLGRYLNSTAKIYQEYGFSALVRQQYSYDLTTFDVEIYEMLDSDAAFGIYSIFRDYNKPPLGFGDDGIEYDYQVTFWQDNYYIVVMGQDGSEETKEIIKTTAKQISNKIGSAKMPDILSELPQQYLQPRSTGTIEGLLGLNRKLYLGQDNILNIDGENVKAAYGCYKNGNETAELILVKLDNPEKAQIKVNKIFGSKYSTHPNKEFKLFKDRRGQYYSVKAGKNLLIVYKATSSRIIEQLFQ